MNIFIDTETSGMVNYKNASKGSRFPRYDNLDAYDSCRIVSICWIICQNDKVIEQGYFLINPKDFTISVESQQIHGISQEEAIREGQDISNVLNTFVECVKRCESIIAHNIDFDINVILSECYRNNLLGLIDIINTKHHICTMKKGQHVMGLTKWPKLSELYEYLFHEKLKDAHNALMDTIHCMKCYNEMFPKDPSIFFFHESYVKLTHEQQTIIYEPNDTDMIIVASAGSGKTMTTLARIKHLLDRKICKEEEIILTTFTRDAALDLKNRLFELLGYYHNVKIGTIDGISKYFIHQYMSNDDHSNKHVGEYGYDFLKLIKTNKNVLNNYKYVFVDEFQDINELQYLIIKEMVNQGLRLFAVGDDSQNIFTFRGSSSKYLSRFYEYFPGSSVFFLTVNFRSSSKIVDFANVAAEQHVDCLPKTMSSNGENSKDKLPEVRYFKTARDQAYEICTLIKKREGVNLEEVAILCPNNSGLYLLEELLTKERIPHVNLDQRLSKRNNHVCLGTIHKSKGLEWDCVYIINCGDDVIPKQDIESDRKMFYVGITRPRKELYLFYCGRPCVSRFISEIPREYYNFVNFRVEYFSSNPVIKEVVKDNTIDGFVRSIPIQKIIELKENGYIPDRFEKLQLHDPFENYPFDMNYIEREHLQDEFNEYIRIRIYQNIDMTQNTRYLLDYLHKSRDSICLSFEGYCVFRKYRNLIYEHEDNLASLRYLRGKIYTNDVDTFVDIIKKFRNKKEMYQIPFRSIKVYNKDNLTKDLITFLDKDMTLLDVCSLTNYDLWIYALYMSSLKRNRFKNLYKEIDHQMIITQSNRWILQMSEKIMGYMATSSESNIRCGIHIYTKQLEGIIDIMLNDNEIFLFQMGCVQKGRDESYDKILQGLILCEITNKSVDSFKIIQVMNGQLLWSKDNQILRNDKKVLSLIQI